MRIMNNGDFYTCVYLRVHLMINLYEIVSKLGKIPKKKYICISIELKCVYNERVPPIL